LNRPKKRHIFIQNYKKQVKELQKIVTLAFYKLLPRAFTAISSPG